MSHNANSIPALGCFTQPFDAEPSSHPIPAVDGLARTIGPVGRPSDSAVPPGGMKKAEGEGGACRDHYTTSASILGSEQSLEGISPVTEYARVDGAVSTTPLLGLLTPPVSSHLKLQPDFERDLSAARPVTPPVSSIAPMTPEYFAGGVVPTAGSSGPMLAGPRVAAVSPTASPANGSDSNLIEGQANLLVVGLTRDIDETRLMAMFKPFGEVRSVNVVRSVGTGISRGFGFVLFAKESEGNAALKVLNGSQCGPNSLSVRRSYHRGAIVEHNTIYVRNIPLTATDDEVFAMLQPYGPVVSGTPQQDLSRGPSDPAAQYKVATLELPSVGKAKAAIEAFHNKPFPLDFHAVERQSGRTGTDPATGMPKRPPTLLVKFAEHVSDRNKRKTISTQHGYVYNAGVKQSQSLTPPPAYNSTVGLFSHQGLTPLSNAGGEIFAPSSLGTPMRPEAAPWSYQSPATPQAQQHAYVGSHDNYAAPQPVQYTLISQQPIFQPTEATTVAAIPVQSSPPPYAGYQAGQRGRLMQAVTNDFNFTVTESLPSSSGNAIWG